MTDSFPVLDPRDRVPVQPGTRVPPQKIEPPEMMTIIWSHLDLPEGTEFTQELRDAQIGRVIRVNWGKSFSYKAIVRKVEPRGEDAEVTLMRVPDDTPG